MGPSGAGKSTVLHILGMHDSSWAGEYHFLGHPIHKLPKKDRAELYKKHIGFVFQSYHLLDSLTVYENLDIPLSYRNIKKSERESIVCDTLDRFNIVAKKDLYPNQLSGAAAACRDCTGHGRESENHTGGRTHGKSAFEPGQGNHGVFPEN